MITKQEAWVPRSDEKVIPLVTKGLGLEFTRKWFLYRNQCTWSTFFTQKFSGKKPVKMIQIGVFEGMDLVWCLQNILKHPDSRVVAIDPWEKTTKLDQTYMDGCYARALNNLRHWQDKVEVIRGYSSDVLSDLLVRHKEINGITLKPGSFDIVVIDGDHNAPAVYDDGVKSLNLVRVGGWLVFDDVRNQQPKTHHVQEGLDQFVAGFSDRVKLAWYHRYCDCLERVQ